MSSSPAGVSGDESTLVGRLSLEQKVRLLTGADAWTLYGESAIGLRPIVVSDGPAGVRGRRLDPALPSSSLPCPVALGATWDEKLVRELTLALGREARAKGIDAILGPTVNIVRTPLSGRGFECFSEDPVLSARLAAAYTRGVQDAGVAATAKHYVANDSETDRRTYDARIAEPVLRELYLAPFEACVVEADIALVMAAYNSVNGESMTANRRMLREVLKTEWAFQGVVVSDWSATRTTVASARAGLDLVMPGPDGPWGGQLVDAVRAGHVPETEIDDKVIRLLRLARRVGALHPNGEGDTERFRVAAGASSRGNDAPPAAALVDRRLLRDVATRSFVLLRNQRQTVPLQAQNLRRVALIGPNATRPQTQGGGSVRVLPVSSPGLSDAFRTAVGDDVTISVRQGCQTWATVPAPADGRLQDPISGAPGVRLEIRDDEGAVVQDGHFPSSVLTWWDRLPAAVNLPGSHVLMRARYRAAASGPYLVGVAGIGELRIAVDGSPMGEATTLRPRDVVEAFSRPPELRVPLRLEADQEVELMAEYRPDGRGREAGFVTMRLGITPEVDDDDLLAEAVAAATEADVAIVVVGSTDGTESEGYDRDTLVLPGRQDELVRRVAAANPRTVVVLNSGMPVLMPWVDDVAAIIQVWLPGQAFGEALADALLGTAEPGGRLPVSMPRASGDSPVLYAHPEAGELNYSEGLLVGYRGYDRHGTEPLFCFGHGLGYTDWTYEALTPAAPSITAGDELSVVVTVRNTGQRPGREVVQLYLEEPADDPSRPLRSLASFGVANAEPGQAVDVRLTVPPRAFAHFDARLRQWVWYPGTYRLHAGRSSRDLRLMAEATVRRR